MGICQDDRYRGGFKTQINISDITAHSFGAIHSPWTNVLQTRIYSQKWR
jgi:hypothetical protein